MLVSNADGLVVKSRNLMNYEGQVSRQDDRVVARIGVDQQLVLHRELDVLEIVS